MSTPATNTNYPSLEESKCPYPLFHQLQEDGGVHQLAEGDGEFLVTKNELIRGILKDSESFSSATPLNGEAQTGWGTSMFSVDGQEHDNKRSVAYKSFNPKRLKEYQPTIRALAADLVSSFADRGSVEFVWEFSNLLSSRVMFHILGLREDELAWITRIQFDGIGARYLPDDLRARQDRDGEKLHAYMAKIVADRIADPSGEDAISEIIRAYMERDGSVDHDYLTAEASVILIGGVLTPAHMMSNAMMLLTENPDQLALVQEDHSRIPRMLEEALRVEAPDQFMPRYCTRDTEVGGVPVTEGSLLLLSYAAGNRDPETFPDPESFDVSRAEVKKHFGFGYGTHFCMGAQLARMIGEEAFGQLLGTLGDIQLSPDQDGFDVIPSIFNRAPAAVNLTFSRRAAPDA
jgi:cytochrome P450